jgi:uncharacterized protein (TIGR02118 family)
MHCLTVIYPQPDDTEAFKSYYEDKHLPLVRRLPGLRSMHHAFPEAMGPAQVFCIFQAYFDDAQAFEAAMTSDAGREVAGDVPNYSPKGAQVFHFPVETVHEKA